MAHNCPDCGYLCHCGGDIDDICWDENSEEAMHCGHCFGKEQDELDDYDDYLADDPDGGADVLGAHKEEGRG